MWKMASRVPNYAATRQRIADRDGLACWLCLKPLKLGRATLDHVTPRSAGGGHEDTNLKLAHARCNWQRGSTLPELTQEHFAKLREKRALKRRRYRENRKRRQGAVIAHQAETDDDRSHPECPSQRPAQ